MQTKSNIQIITELMKKKALFCDELSELNEQYKIEDNVFVCGINGEVQEPTHGYMGLVKEFDTIDEAFDDFDILTQGIRIKDGKYQVGYVYEKLEDADQKNIIDLTNSTML